MGERRRRRDYQRLDPNEPESGRLLDEETDVRAQSDDDAQDAVRRVRQRHFADDD